MELVLSLLGDGLFRKITKNRETEIFLVACFDEHEDPCDKYDRLQNTPHPEPEESPVRPEEEGHDRPVQYEPRHKEIESLKGVKAAGTFVAKPLGG